MTQFFINKKKQKEENKVKEEISIYTFFGKHNFLDEDSYPRLDADAIDDLFSSVDAYAIKITRGNHIQYFVKRGKYGRLFNPIGLYSEGTSHKQLRHAGKPEWTFAKTTQKIFSYYIDFLRTKNPAYLNNAEREV